MGIGALLPLLAPLGVPGAFVVVVLGIFFWLRQQNSNENRERVAFHTVEVGVLRAECAKLRAERDAADAHTMRWRSIAIRCHGLAHAQRLASLEDRQRADDALSDAELAPIAWAPLAELPPLEAVL